MSERCRREGGRGREVRVREKRGRGEARERGR